MEEKQSNAGRPNKRYSIALAISLLEEIAEEDNLDIDQASHLRQMAESINKRTGVGMANDYLSRRTVPPFRQKLKEGIEKVGLDINYWDAIARYARYRNFYHYTKTMNQEAQDRQLDPSKTQVMTLGADPVPMTIKQIGGDQIQVFDHPKFLTNARRLLLCLPVDLSEVGLWFNDLLAEMSQSQIALLIYTPQDNSIAIQEQFPNAKGHTIISPNQEPEINAFITGEQKPSDEEAPHTEGNQINTGTQFGNDNQQFIGGSHTINIGNSKKE